MLFSLASVVGFFEFDVDDCLWSFFMLFLEFEGTSGGWCGRSVCFGVGVGAWRDF